jgi:hypothetical protein
MNSVDRDSESLHNQVHENRSKVIKGLLVLLGSACVGLGLLGVILPLIPTTPFLLLAAACYANSSERFYVWLLTNRIFGEYIRDWRENRGIPLFTKLWIIAIMVGTMAVTAIFFVPLMPVRIALIVIAVSVSIYIWRQPTKTISRQENDTV